VSLCVTEQDQERFQRMIALLERVEHACEERAEAVHEFGELCAELRSVLISAFPTETTDGPALHIVPRENPV